MKARKFTIRIGNECTRVLINEERLIALHHQNDLHSDFDAWLWNKESFAQISESTLGRVAVQLAMKKRFGANAHWLSSGGFSRFGGGLVSHGQVFKALRPTKRNSNPCSTAVTSTVRLEVHEI